MNPYPIGEPFWYGQEGWGILFDVGFGGFMKMNRYLLIACVYIFAASIAFAEKTYPTMPDRILTPGVLCTEPTERRYPEQIAYCERDVSVGLRWQIIDSYMKKYNFVVTKVNRQQFKIDHFIPLCMGGANDVRNLWPQHASIFKQTDLLEEHLCRALSLGKITQDDAIDKMKKAKYDLSLVPAELKEVETLIF